MSRAITDDTLVAAARDQVSCDLQGEAAILNLASGVYYGLDAVAASIWRLIQTPQKFSAICQAITEEYAVSAEQARADVRGFLDELMQEGLVELLPGEASDS